jgi:hypothetical protein
MGDVASSIWSLVIAIHTFLLLHMVFRLFPEYHWSVGHSEDIYLERPLLLSYALISTDIR